MAVINNEQDMFEHIRSLALKGTVDVESSEEFFASINTLKNGGFLNAVEMTFPREGVVRFNNNFGQKAVEVEVEKLPTAEVRLTYKVVPSDYEVRVAEMREEVDRLHRESMERKECVAHVESVNQNNSSMNSLDEFKRLTSRLESADFTDLASRLESADFTDLASRLKGL